MRHLRALAVARDYDELLAAIRARRDALKVPHLVIDDVAGLQTGYASKLLADPPIRNLGAVTLGPLLGTLGLAIALVHDGAALVKVEDRLTPRRHAPKRADRGGAPDFVEVGEAGIAVDDVMRRQRRVQLVG
jgi:hypothetical protein